MKIILTNTRNDVIDIVQLYIGTIDSSPIRISEIFKEAIARNASAILVCHNHPSGDPTPSPDDVASTRSIIAGGKLLGIELTDHLVFGTGKWISMKERGLAFN